MAKANGETQSTNPEAEFAKAWTELSKGERTAAALETHLDALESKIDALLKHAEGMNDQDKWSEELEARDASTSAGTSSRDGGKVAQGEATKKQESV